MDGWIDLITVAFLVHVSSETAQFQGTKATQEVDALQQFHQELHIVAGAHLHFLILLTVTSITVTTLLGSWLNIRFDSFHHISIHLTR